MTARIVQWELDSHSSPSSTGESSTAKKTVQILWIIRF